MKKAQYIVFEGTEGTGKSTQTNKLVEYLRNNNYKVLETKEPGTKHLNLTMKLREIMLSNEYDTQLTILSRELISQSIRSIHLEKLIYPAINTYDYIIQDRGMLSGLAYGQACGCNIDVLENLCMLSSKTNDIKCMYELYDNVIYLHGNISSNLDRAQKCKQEYESGDAIESKGNLFMNQVSDNMDYISKHFKTVKINVDNKTINQVHSDILRALKI